MQKINNLFKITMKGYECVNKWLSDLYSSVGIKVRYVSFNPWYDTHYDTNVENATSGLTLIFSIFGHL